MSKKITELDVLAVLAPEDILILVDFDDLPNSPKQMGTKGFFGNIPTDVTIDGVATSRGLVFTLLDPPAAPTVAIDPVVGNLNGTYQYKMTFVTANGESTLGTISADVAPANQKVLLTDLPTSDDPLVTTRKIYRTKAGVPDIYYYLATNASDASYTDNTADGALGANAHYLTGSLRPAGGISIGDEEVFRDYGLTLVIGRGAAENFETAGDGAYNNVFVGDYCGGRFVSGNHNTMVGTQIGYGAAQPLVSKNSYFGAKTASLNAAGNYNSYFGAYAGTNATGNYGVFLGINAGYYETGDSKLFIDNAERTNEADARVKALVYGVFAAAPANQTLTFNAKIGVNVEAPLAQHHIDQPINDAAIPVLALDQADISEGFINFIGSDRGVITGVTNSTASVRVEIGGVVHRLALYADA